MAKKITVGWDVITVDTVNDAELMEKLSDAQRDCAQFVHDRQLLADEETRAALEFKRNIAKMNAEYDALREDIRQRRKALYLNYEAIKEQRRAAKRAAKLAVINETAQTIDDGDSEPSPEIQA